MELEIKNLDKFTVLIKFKTQREMCSALIRMQEHYEGTFFAGKVFTLGQIREWYQKKYHSFSYYDDWAGFNMPSTVFDMFRKGLFDPLSSEEAKILELIPSRIEPYYVIAISEDMPSDEGTLWHERCHAMYFCNENYRNKVNELIEKHRNNLKEVEKYLLKYYNKKVLLDEFNAYLSTNTDVIEEENIEIDEGTIKEFKKLFNKYKRKRKTT